MCGIAGHVTRGGLPDREAVAEAMRRIAHRGPDGEGIQLFPQACLGHRRLSIIDLGHSAQPMDSPDGRHSIVFNGEIYNYLELRADLEKCGILLQTQGDTEVLLHLYIQFGAGCLSRLNGMFAFAVWDNHSQTLFAARDRVGKKPFFYAQDADGLAFASELTALLAFPWIDRSLDAQAVNRFFANQYVGGAGSIYRGVKQLRAGQHLTYREGRVSVGTWWTPPHPAADPLREPALREELESLLDDAVRLRLRSDVPLGAFLSGGLDSSIIVASMRKQGCPVDSFSVGFGADGYDESDYARQAAEYFGCAHHPSQVEWDLGHSIHHALNRFGEPYADPSAVPTWHLCRHTKSLVTVALSGDGADELFGGYRRYYARQQLAKWLAIPKPLRKNLLEPLIRLLPESDRYFAASNGKKLKLFAKLANQIERSPGAVAPQTFSLEERLRLLNPEWCRAEDEDLVARFGLEALEPVAQMMLADVGTYLVDDILVKLDRMSMAHGLEARSPFLDYRVVEFACRLPLEWKIRGGQQKYLLRETFRDRLPAALADRRKHGFSVPLGTWFKGPVKPLFEEIVLAQPTPGCLNRREVEALWFQHLAGKTDNGFKLWSLLAFHHWHHGSSNP